MPRFSSTTFSRVTWHASFESVLEAGPHRVTFDGERFPDAPENAYAASEAAVQSLTGGDYTCRSRRFGG